MSTFGRKLKSGPMRPRVPKNLRVDRAGPEFQQVLAYTFITESLVMIERFSGKET